MTMTKTADGDIPAHVTRTGMHLPVRIRLTGSLDTPQPPETTYDGRYVYALPGGGRYVPPRAPRKKFK